MDLQTAKDYIDDLKIERALLLAEIDQLRDMVQHLTTREQQLGHDYFHWRQTAEKLIANLQAVEAERDQWQRQAVQHG